MDLMQVTIKEAISLATKLQQPIELWGVDGNKVKDVHPPDIASGVRLCSMCASISRREYGSNERDNGSFEVVFHCDECGWDDYYILPPGAKDREKDLIPEEDYQTQLRENLPPLAELIEQCKQYGAQYLSEGENPDFSGDRAWAKMLAEYAHCFTEDESLAICRATRQHLDELAADKERSQKIVEDPENARLLKSTGVRKEDAMKIALQKVQEANHG